MDQKKKKEEEEEEEEEIKIGQNAFIKDQMQITNEWRNLQKKDGIVWSNKKYHSKSAS